MTAADSNREPNPIGQEVMVPPTGEIIPLDGPSDQLAEAVFRMKELEDELVRARRTVSLELTRRLDMENLRTANAGSWKVSVAAPAKDWDTDRIAGVLDELVEEQRITPGAMDRVVKLERKLDKRELTKMLKTLPEEAAARLNECSSPSRRLRSVKVEQGPEA